MNDVKIKIFLVDDDKLYLKLLEVELLNQGDFDIETYSTGERCLKHMPHLPDVIVLDYYLDDIDKTAMNGIETLDKIKAVNPEIPVIMLSSQDSIDIAVSCMHHKAFDYVVKSETAFLRLKKIIPAVFQYKQIEKQLKWYMERM
jgi:two-component system, OmpR family, response regulator